MITAVASLIFKDEKHERDRKLKVDVSHPYIVMGEALKWLEDVNKRIDEDHIALANLDSALAETRDAATINAIEGSMMDFKIHLGIMKSQKEAAENRAKRFYELHLYTSVALDLLDPKTATEH